MGEKDNNLYWYEPSVTASDRRERYGYRSCVLWFTGLSAAGKSTLANLLCSRFHAMGIRSYVLDGDNIRHGLNKDLGFTPEGRKENIRRIGEVSKLFVDAGIIAMTAFISPYREDRSNVRKLFPDGEFVEIYVKCSISECERRDPKGIYKKAKAGQVKEFTGISAPYEEPEAAELIIETGKMTPEGSVNEILKYLVEKGYINEDLVAQHEKIYSSSTVGLNQSRRQLGMDQEITIVSGLPRSGTSMMMRMLEAGGMQVVVDNIRQADVDNPKGYYEFEQVKEIRHDRTWIESLHGKVVKMVSMLLYDLPRDKRYKIVFMLRSMDEVLASQQIMLDRRGERGHSREEMAALFSKHLGEIKAWLADQENMEVLFVNYNEILKNPGEIIPLVNRFFNSGLNAEEMIRVVDQSLYRQRNEAVKGVMEAAPGKESGNSGDEKEKIEAQLRSLGYM
jgi:adenylylsulfate kinase